MRNIQALRGAAAKPGTAQPSKPPTPRFAWRRQKSYLEHSPGYPNYQASHELSVTGSEGVVNIGYRVGAERAKFALTWNPLPDVLTPGQTVRVTLKIADTGCTAEKQGTGGGNFSVWVQKSQDDPGSGWYIYQPMVAILGREAPMSRDYVFEVPDCRPGHRMWVKVGVYNG